MTNLNIDKHSRDEHDDTNDGTDGDIVACVAVVDCVAAIDDDRVRLEHSIKQGEQKCRTGGDNRKWSTILDSQRIDD